MSTEKRAAARKSTKKNARRAAGRSNPRRRRHHRVRQAHGGQVSMDRALEGYVVGMRAAGQWFVKIGSVVGAGLTIEQAMQDACLRAGRQS